MLELIPEEGDQCTDDAIVIRRKVVQIHIFVLRKHNSLHGQYLYTGRGWGNATLHSVSQFKDTFSSPVYIRLFFAPLSNQITDLCFFHLTKKLMWKLN